MKRGVDLGEGLSMEEGAALFIKARSVIKPSYVYGTRALLREASIFPLFGGGGGHLSYPRGWEPISKHTVFSLSLFYTPGTENSLPLPAL